MKKFATLFGAALMAGSALCATQAMAADDLTITSWGGAYQESQRNAFFTPFVAAGNKVTEAEYNGEIAKMSNSPKNKAKLDAGGVDPLPLSPDQFAEVMRADGVELAKSIKAANIKID